MTSSHVIKIIYMHGVVSAMQCGCVLAGLARLHCLHMLCVHMLHSQTCAFDDQVEIQ